MQDLFRSESAPAWSSPAPGVRIRRLVDGSGIDLVLYRIAPATRFQVHAHPFPELGLIISGAGMLVSGQGEHPARAGDSYYFPPSMEHGFRVPDDGEPVVLLDVSSASASQPAPPLEEMIRALATTHSARLTRGPGTPGDRGRHGPATGLRRPRAPGP